MFSVNSPHNPSDYFLPKLRRHDRHSRSDDMPRILPITVLN